MIERLRKALADRPFRANRSDHHLTVSVGITEVATGEPLEAALRRADVALYAAKSAGRNRVSVRPP